MKHRVYVLIMTWAMALAAQPEQEWTSLVESEKAFSRCSVEKGMRQAFLQILADEAVVFRPQAIAARPFYAARPEQPNLVLKWAPQVAEISALADLGYTAGPFELTVTRNADTSTSRGYFVSMWKKQRDGSWKVVLDTGVDWDAAASAVAQVVNPRANQAWPPVAADTSAARRQLRQADVAFGETAAAAGARKAVHRYYADSVRVYRDQRPAKIVTAATQDAAVAYYENKCWRPDYAAVAASADLGYTYGLCVSTDPSDGTFRESYVRFWRYRGGEWRVVLDVTVPWPAEK